MYGIVNKALNEMIVSKYGEEIWNRVRLESGFEDESFILNISYDDSLTYNLISHASRLNNIPINDFLVDFGKFWVINSGLVHYNSLMRAGGSNIKEFLINLPNFHNRIILIFPKLRPPEFKITDIMDNQLTVHYYSSRNGLQYFVKGLLIGVGEMYDKKVEVTIYATKDIDSNHDIFIVNWKD